MIIIQHRTSKHSTSREPITPWYLVLHDTEGYMPGTLAWLADTPAPPATASVHYLVTRKGEVYQLGYDRWSMWHAGRTYWADRAPGVQPNQTGNYDMIGIEIEHVTAEQGKAYPAAQLAALDELIAHIFDRNPTLKGVVGHKDIAYPRGRKVDPQLDVTQYSIQAVRARLGQVEEEPMPIDVVHDVDAVAAAQQKLIDAGLLSRAHAGGDAASVGLLMLLCARLLDQVGAGMDLEAYELRLVKKGSE